MPPKPNGSKLPGPVRAALGLFLAALLPCGATLALAGGFSHGFPTVTAQRRVVAPSDFPIGIERRARLEAHLVEHPQDQVARLRLARVLFGQALAAAQASWSPELAPDGDPTQVVYSQYVSAMLRESPDAAASRAIALEVTRQAGRPEVRAQAWATLAYTNAILRRSHAQLECLATAARECPDRYGPRFASFRTSLELRQAYGEERIILLR